MELELKGIERVIRNLQAQPQRFREATEDTLMEMGADLQGRAEAQAPVDTGDLRRSASTSRDAQASEPTVLVGFDSQYAFTQHEHTEYRHPRGGKAKYLEDPLKEMTGRYLQHLGAGIQRRLGGNP